MLESSFVALLDYKLFVSASIYAKYYFSLREKLNPILETKKLDHFNRFKKPSPRNSFNKEKQ
jgi:hypothetical protein